jgi:hypothetical protein
MYFTVSSSFLISFVMGGATRAGGLSSLMHLSGRSRVPLFTCSSKEPQMALAYQFDAIAQGPKNSQFPGPNPLPLALVMDMHASKTLCTERFKSYVHK